MNMYIGTDYSIEKRRTYFYIAETSTFKQNSSKQKIFASKINVAIFMLTSDEISSEIRYYFRK